MIEGKKLNLHGAQHTGIALVECLVYFAALPLENMKSVASIKKVGKRKAQKG